MTQIEFADEFFFELGAFAGRVGDRYLNEAAFAGFTENPVDPLARHFQPLRDRVLGLALAGK